MSEYIEVFGARAHNLRNIDVAIPRNKLVVITGLSGSGKSSLAFNTIYAEGQRRYMETFSAYARQFLGNMERPEVDKIEGLSPVISIEQKTTSRNPRSTVGTVTELSDFLRLLFARASTAFSYNTGEKMISYSDAQIVALIAERYVGRKIAVLAPVVRARKGHYRELFEQITRMGFIRARVDGKVVEVSSGYRLDRYKTHDIEIVVDRIIVAATWIRLKEALIWEKRAKQELKSSTTSMISLYMDLEKALGFVCTAIGWSSKARIRRGYFTPIRCLLR